MGASSTEVSKKGSKEKIVSQSEDVSKQPGGASQMIIQKRLPLAGFDPGEYTVTMKVTDKKRNQTVTKSAPFTIT